MPVFAVQSLKSMYQSHVFAYRVKVPWVEITLDVSFQFKNGEIEVLKSEIHFSSL